MAAYELDDVDRGILHNLQEDARRVTTEELGEIVGVSSCTVRNRIANLEAVGIIGGYHPEIDSEKAGYQLHLSFECTASAEDRSRVTERALGVRGVIEVNELLGGQKTVLIEAIAQDVDLLADVTDGINGLPLDVHRTYLRRRSYVQPFDHFTGRAGND